MPTGIATTVLGAAVLVALARRRGDGPTGAPARTALSVPSRRRFAVVLVTGAIAVTGCLLLGLLGGHTWIRTGDVVLWVQGEGAPVARFALDERAPRVVAALLAGGALALADSVVQATSRNPLAEPA